MAHFRAVLRRARSHLTRNVVAYLALFVALGGTSYGLAAGSIDSREIKNNTVRTGDVRNNEIRSRDIRNRTIVARDLLSNSLGGDQIDETELGEIPLATRSKSADDALALGGLASSSYSLLPPTNTVDVPDANTTAATVLSVPGYGTLSVPPAGCETQGGSEDLSYSWANTSASTQDLFQLISGATPTAPSHGTVAAGAEVGSNVDGGTLYVQLRVRPASTGSLAATITLFARNGGAVVGDACRVSVQALVSG
jgi:hypothetical protein